MSLEEKFDAIFNAGKFFIIQNTVKRINGDREDRISWKEVQQPGEQIINSCKWEGFNTISECLDDILEKYSIKEVNI